MRPKVGSLFAGVGGFDMGLEAAGFEVAWQVEIDKDAVSVLERHYPNVPRVRDIREAGAHNLAPVDVITFGSPCQGFSVAGRGDGLEDARSGLFGEAIRIIRELRPAVAVWENVPGAFSANDGRDFGAVLAALADAGAVDIAWRVLDARWFGVPQRRRRIFLVADFGAERAAQILFESEGSRRDSAAGRSAREGAPGDAEDGAGVIGFDARNGVGTGDVGIAVQAGAGSGRGISYNCLPLVGQAVAAEGGNRTSGPLDIATACNAHGGPHGRLDFESETFVVANSVQASAGHHGHSSPRGDGSDNLIAFHLTQDPINGAESPALGAGNENGCSTVAVAISENQHSEVRETPYANALATSGGKIGQGYQAVREGMAVRRLTPRETERLQGWPEILHIIGASLDDICRAVQSSSQEEGATRWVGDTLRSVWISQAGGEASPGYLGRAGYVPRALSALPRSEAFGTGQLGTGTGAEGNLLDLRIRVSTDQAKALNHLWGAELSSRDGTQIGPPSMGCIARLEGWTRWRADGSEIPDGPRYRMVGNGVVAPVAQWLGERLFRALEVAP